MKKAKVRSGLVTYVPPNLQLCIEIPGKPYVDYTYDKKVMYINS